MITFGHLNLLLTSSLLDNTIRRNKNMKINLLLLFALSSSITFSQVAVSYDVNVKANEQTVLDLSSIHDKGVLGPKAELKGRYDNQSVPELVPGIVVYNTSTTQIIDPFTGLKVTDLIPGYYSWNGTRWMSFEAKSTNTIIENTSLSAASLGYYPLGVHGNAPATFTKNGYEARQSRCVNKPYDPQTVSRNSSYCSYDIYDAQTKEIAGMDWDTAFLLAKELGGYLPVITSDFENNFVITNFFFIDKTAVSRYKNTWLGFKKTNTPGDPSTYMWISGEHSNVNWKSGLYEYYFESGFPKGNDCVYVPSTDTAANVPRHWRDTSCSDKTVNGEPFSYLIVEFLN